MHLFKKQQKQLSNVALQKTTTVHPYPMKYCAPLSNEDNFFLNHSVMEYLLFSLSMFVQGRWNGPNKSAQARTGESGNFGLAHAHSDYVCACVNLIYFRMRKQKKTSEIPACLTKV